MNQSFAKALSFAKNDFLKVEVIAKGTLAGGVAGGLGALSIMYATGKQFRFSPEHIAEMKATFISGFVIGAVLYLKNSPLGKAAQSADSSK